MRKTGAGLIIFAIFLHFIACDWDSDLTIKIPSATSFFFGIIIPFLLIPIGILIYRSKIEIPYITGGLPRPRPPRPKHDPFHERPLDYPPPSTPQAHLRPLLSNIRCPECGLSYAWDGQAKVCGNCNYGIDNEGL